MKKLSTLLAATLCFVVSAFAQIPPVAAFTYTPTCVVAGDTVHFTNTSTNFTRDLWVFGDPGSGTGDTTSSTNATHLYSTAGTYTVTLYVTGTGVLDSVKHTITVIAAIITPATDTICSGASTTLTASGGTTYRWSNFSPTAAITVTPTVTTVYTVTVTGAAGCTASASVNVVVNRTPTATITPATSTICTGHNAILTASGGVGVTGLTYAWSNAVTTAADTVSPGATTNYTVTVSNGHCSATATTTVTVANFTPTITPATDTICSGSATTLTATAAGTGNTYLWSNGGTTAAITVSPTTTTLYTVSVTETNGCSGIATRNVVVSGNGVINAAVTPAHDTVCAGVGVPQPVTLTASGGGTYAWSNGLGTAATVNVTPFATTTYTVTVTNGACSATASSTVVVARTPTAAITPPAVTICSGHSTVLTANGGVGATGLTYAWSNGNDSVAITVTPVATTTYTVTVSSGGQCTATASATVTVATFTPAITPATDTICGNNSTTLTATGGAAGSVYAWSTGAITTAITVTPTTTTTYSVSVTELNGCSGIASRVVTVIPNITAAITPARDTICSGKTVTLTASGGTAYVWSSGQRTAAITVAPVATTNYAVTVTVGTGCSATATATVVVNASPVAGINPPTPVNICGGQSTTLTATGGGTYVWSTGSDSTSITVSPTANSTYAITVTSANGCTAAATKNVGVTPAPVAAIAPATATVCAGHSITLTASGAGVGVGGYVWSNAAVTAAITVTPTITTTYTVTVTGAGGCSASASRTVTVDSIPVVTIIPNTDTICAGTTTTLIATGGPNYAWSNGGQSQAILITPAATTLYKVTVTNSNNCSASDSVNVVVKSLPAIAIAPGNTAICTGNSATLTASGGLSYAWSSGGSTAAITVSPTVTTTYYVTATGADGCSAVDSATVISTAVLQPVITPSNPSVCLGGSVTLSVTAGASYIWSSGATTQNITVSPTTNTPYTVTVSNGPGCSATASVNVSVFSAPAAVITPAIDSVCAGQSSTVTASGGTIYAWSNGTTTAALTVTPTANTKYYVTVTGAGGCTAIDSITIKVNPNPTVTIGPGGPPTAVCAGTSVVLTAAGAGVTGTFTYAWSNGNDSAAITVVPTATTTYTVTATSSNGCSATASKTVTVNPSPTLTITPPSDTICSGQSATLTANAGGGFVVYTWSTGGVGGGAAITVTPITTTTYRVTATEGFGPGACTAVDSAVVVVKPVPTVAITPATVTICAGQSATLTATGGATYVWSSGSTVDSTTVTPTATTTYTVTATAANGCSATANRVVTVRPAPVATINPATSSICIGNPVTLNAAIAGPGNTYVWSNGGTTGAITVSPTATTTYSVTITNLGGCSATASAVVIADSTLVPVITPSNPTICAGNPVALTVTAGTTYHWNTGAPTQTINVTPTTSTTYTVTVTNGAGCSGTASVNVTVVPAVTATITPATANICAGTSATLTASGGPNFVWSTGSDSASITVHPAGTTTYTVTVSNGAGCSATASRTVTIIPAPTVAINPPAASNICTGQSVTLTAVSPGGGGPNTYAWSNGSTTAAITVTPTATTTYTVTATNATGCTATATKTVTVNAAPTAAITPANDTICSGSSATLTASGGGGPGGYVWSTGARTPTITVTPTASTTYDVTVTGVGGCTAVASSNVIVNPRPVATVSPSTDTICSGFGVSLTAAGGGTYAWSNSDNTAIIAVAPTATTTYTVTVTGNDGCTASAAATVTVNTVSAAIAPSVASICTGQTDTLRASGTGAYAWSNGSTTASIIVTPSATTTYSLTVTAGNNCSASASATVNVNSTLVPVVTPASASICIGNATTLTVSQGTSYQWSNGSTTQSILIAPVATTTYNVTVSNGVGCSGTASVVVTVNNLPTAAISPATASVCQGSSTILTASGGTTYAWSNGNTNAAITVTPTANTTYTVTVSNAGGCSATASRTVTVNPLPLAGIAPGAITICAGASTTLTARGGTGYTWSTSATTAAITVSPTATTSYTVTVTSAAGCSATVAATVTVTTVTASITPATDTTCSGANSTLTASGGTAYRWNTGAPTAAITVAPVATTTYTVTVTTGGAGGCSATASRTVNVVVPVATISPATDSICKGATTTLTANGGSTYAWSVGANTRAITVSPIVTTTYTVTATNNQGCTATTSRTVVVKANPTVSVTPVTDTICGGVHVTITAIGTGTYSWSNSGTSQIINVTPVASTNYTVTLTGTNGCSASATSGITVRPISAAINPAISSLCSGQSDTLVASGGGTYLWTNSSTTSTIIVSPTTTTNYSVIVTGSNNCTATASATVNVNGTLTPVITPTNPAVCQGGSVTLVVTSGTSYAWSTGPATQSITVSPNTATTYSVTVSNGVGCSGTASVSVAVNSNPVAVVNPASDTICSGQNAVLTAGGGTSYAWSNSASSASITVSPGNPTTYTVTVTNANSCTATASGTVTVLSVPVPSMNPSLDTICSGESVLLTASGGTNYLWSTGSDNQDTTVSPTASTSYTVTVSAGGNCTATASALVTVNSLPVAVITPAPAAICNGQSTTLTASGGIDYVWNTGDDTDVITESPTTTTPYSVTVTNANGCSASASVSITVNSLPNAAISPDTAKICQGNSATLTASGGSSYAWSNSTTTIAITVNPAATSNYSVTVTGSNGCSASVNGVVVVNNNPSVFINPPSASVCQGSSVTLTAIGGINYVWSNSATVDSIVVSPTSATTYSVTTTDANNCSATASESVSVNSNPVAGITGGNNTICKGATVTLTASGGGTYDWSDSTTTAVDQANPTTTTTYTVTVTSFGTGCSATASTTITVDSVNATINPAVSSICTSQSETITASGGGTYLWSNGNTTAAITVTPLLTSTYTVTITATNTCSATLSATVDVNAFLQPVITPANPAICAGDTVSLSVTAGTTYHWSTTATTQGITVNPTSNATYTVTVTNNGACSGTASVNVIVHSNPVATINPATSSICAGQSDSLTAGTGTGYTWSNGSTTAGINVTPTSSTPYSVTVTNSNNCSASATASITVNSVPVAAINPASDTICSGRSATLTASGGASYAWSDASTTAVVTEAPLTTSTYFVTVTSSGCSATASAIITVNQTPVAEVSPDTASVCAGQSVIFTAYDTTGAGNPAYTWSTLSLTDTINAGPLSTTTYTVTITSDNCSATANAVLIVNSIPIAAIQPTTAAVCIGQSTFLTATGGNGGYAWSTGDVTASISVSPVNNTTYTVTVTSTGGCSATASALVTVNSLPIASVNPGSAIVCAGQNATFTATGGTAYSWSSGATTLSITVIPVINTLYTVTVSNANGCTATATATVIVNAPVVPVITPSTDTVCAGTSATLTASGNVSYAWSNGNTVAGITVAPANSTTYTVTGTDANGCSSTTSAEVVIKAAPAAAINPAVSSICSGQSTGLRASGGGTYVWSNSSTSAAISVTPANTTTYVVTVTGTNGCSATTSAVVNVNPSLVPVITPVSTSVCQGNSATLTVTAGVTYEWSNGATTQSIQVNPASSTSYSVTVSNGGVCNGNTSASVTVNSNPSVFFSPAATLTICSGENISITASGGVSYAWATSATTAGITVAPTTNTGYDVTVTDGNGCSSTGVATVNVNQSSYTSDTVSICSGGSYTFNGHVLTTTGIYGDTLSTVNGCDSIITLTLNVTPFVTNAYGVTICGGGSFSFGGHTLTQPGVYRDTLTSFQGCDSIIILTLQFSGSLSSTVDTSICAGSSYAFGTTQITTAGTYYDTLSAQGGCDSIVMLNLTIRAISAKSITDTICQGSTYNFNGRVLSAAGTYADILTNSVGCDSIVTLTLVTLAGPVPTWNVNDTICTNGATVVLIPAASPAGGVYSGIGVTGGDSLTVSPSNSTYSITYTVEGTNGCTGVVTQTFITESCILGINEVSLAQLVKLYPNPTNGILVVESGLFTADGPVPAIYDLTGTMIEAAYDREVGKFTVNTAKLSAGVYFIHFNQQGTSVNMKFVKLD